MKIIFIPILLILSILGILDAAYLTYEHYSGMIPPCIAGSIFSDCGSVLRSSYSTIFNIPVSLIGVLGYILEFIILSVIFFKKSESPKKLMLFVSAGGFLSSVYFVFLMVFVIKALCLYCLFSALISTLIFILSVWIFDKQRIELFCFKFRILYKFLAKPVFFSIEPEIIHEFMHRFGEILGSIPTVNHILRNLFRFDDNSLEQKINGIKFSNPVGLAAGFDYEGRLTGILSSVGFGFQTVGTITNSPYEGNPKPRLGRLPKSRSLMVYKGFKNPGADKIIEKLTGKIFDSPVGISISRTNIKDLKTLDESIKDIIKCFIKFEKSSVHHVYYELNISCPNLYNDISFYPPENLEKLLKEIDKLYLKKPVFVKMPIGKTDKEFMEMLEVISKHCPKGVIIGNLQTDRNDKSLIQEEVAKFPHGNWSGKATYERSNHLISLAYKKYSKKLLIIGCGGIFSADDAWEKIGRGASLVQLITGMIYEGPGLISEINQGLAQKLQENNYSSISDAVGWKLE